MCDGDHLVLLLLQCLLDLVELRALANGRLQLCCLDAVCLEAVGENLGVGGLDEVLDLWGTLLEDKRPEVRDLGDELVALLVERSLDGFGLAN